MDNPATDWFTLDNAGKLFPSIATDRFTTVFRMSATLSEQVDVEILQLALNHLMERMPYYRVQLKRGFFWYYFEKTDRLPVVEQERYYPCIYLLFRKYGNFPFRVLYYHRRISVEVTHCLTDGAGAVVFLKSLLVEYFKLKGIEGEPAPRILYPGDEPVVEEYEDAFKKYFQQTDAKPPKREYAIHFPFPLTPRGVYLVTTGIMDVARVKKVTKKLGVTVTTFFLALYFDAIYDFLYSHPSFMGRNLSKPVTMNVPINLRSVFPSATMRNFFLTMTPTLYPGDNKKTFDQIAEDLALQLKEGSQPEHLLPYISRNVKGETNILIRLLPLILKDALMPAVYYLLGEYYYTSSISNIGRITMPPPLDEYIERFSFIPSPSNGCKIKTSVVSFKDKLYFTFGKFTRVSVIEKLFFRKLVKMGIPVKIETNF